LLFDFTQTTKEQAEKQQVTITDNGTLHGIVIWVDYQLDQQISVLTRPVPGEHPTWHNHALYTFENLETVHQGHNLVVGANFDEVDDNLVFHFVLDS